MGMRIYQGNPGMIPSAARAPPAIIYIHALCVNSFFTFEPMVVCPSDAERVTIKPVAKETSKEGSCDKSPSPIVKEV